MDSSTSNKTSSSQNSVLCNSSKDSSESTMTDEISTSNHCSLEARMDVQATAEARQDISTVDRAVDEPTLWKVVNPMTDNLEDKPAGVSMSRSEHVTRQPHSVLSEKHSTNSLTEDTLMSTSNRCSSNRSPVEITVYNDRQQLVLDDSEQKAPDPSTKVPVYKACNYYTAMGNKVAGHVHNPMARSHPAYYGYGTSYGYPVYRDNMWQYRKGYHSYRVYPYPQSHYQYPAMPAGSNINIQQHPQSMKQPTRLKPMRSPASVSPSSASQKLSPLTPSPISPAFLSPTNSVAWAPVTDWDRLAKGTPSPANNEWDKIAKAMPPSPANDWSRPSPSPVHERLGKSSAVSGNPLSTMSGFISPLPGNNGYGSNHWESHRHDNQHQLYCNCNNSKCKLTNGKHSHASGFHSSHAEGGSQQSPHTSKQQEEYARKLYSLRHALKSDVFMGYGKNTERYELYSDDRPVSPLKLLEIDRTLDWSGDIALAIAKAGDMASQDDDEYILRSINSMSQALTR